MSRALLQCLKGTGKLSYLIKHSFQSIINFIVTLSQHIFSSTKQILQEQPQSC